jgi:hypothetical protein
MKRYVPIWLVFLGLTKLYLLGLVKLMSDLVRTITHYEPTYFSLALFIPKTPKEKIKVNGTLKKAFMTNPTA